MYRKVTPPKNSSADLSPSQTPAPDGVNATNSQAAVLEAHLGNANILRGVSVAGADFATPSNGTFSNRHPGTIDHSYHYDGAATFKFLASRGIKLVRIPFRWERLQPDLNEELDPAELKRLKDCVVTAEDAGLTVILDMHNYAEYWLHDGAKGVRRTIGSMELPDTALAGVWRRISRAFVDHPRVFYGLMNEPHDIGPVEGLTGARIWELASQKALDAIRENGDKKAVLVSGYGWSAARSWPESHPHGWITDPANNFRYEAHQYFDRNNSGTYRATYVKELEMMEHPELAK
jgi:aryl-phospho-beta-D-glucosidase BglC (GH1 family)